MMLCEKCLSKGNINFLDMQVVFGANVLVGVELLCGFCECRERVEL